MARRLERDRKIYRLLRMLKRMSRGRHARRGQRIEPLSVFAGKPHLPGGDKLTAFPMTVQSNGNPMPPWKDLTEWLKAQIAIEAMSQWALLTFTINLHPDLEAQWAAEGRDPRGEFRDRLRRELDRRVRPGMEFLFAVEAWSNRDKAPTFVHFHGGVFMREPADEKGIKAAAARAGGHPLDRRGRPKIARSVHTKRFNREGATYINYILKSARRRDDRLPEKRLTMSRSLVGACQDFWDMITGKELPHP